VRRSHGASGDGAPLNTRCTSHRQQEHCAFQNAIRRRQPRWAVAGTSLAASTLYSRAHGDAATFFCPPRLLPHWQPPPTHRRGGCQPDSGAAMGTDSPVPRKAIDCRYLFDPPWSRRSGTAVVMSPKRGLPRGTRVKAARVSRADRLGQRWPDHTEAHARNDRSPHHAFQLEGAQACPQRCSHLIPRRVRRCSKG
jgi:hypothetical protein